MVFVFTVVSPFGFGSDAYAELFSIWARGESALAQEAAAGRVVL
jgi:hypothetical protein